VLALGLLQAVRLARALRLARSRGRQRRPFSRELACAQRRIGRNGKFIR